jgi:hypothetical protein
MAWKGKGAYGSTDKPSMALQGEAGHGMARLGWAGHGRARLGSQWLTN